MSPWLIVFLAALGLFFLMSYLFLLIVCGRNKRFIKDFDKAIQNPVYAPCRELILEGRDWVMAKKPTEVTTTSFDGLKLVGEYIPCENARATVIMFHGWKASPVSDFGAGLPYYQSLGLSVLLVHQRAQGKSEGRYMTFGVRERHDVHSWVQWHQKNHGNLPIVLVGLSMGAATVMMACGKEFPSCVKGVIADCGFTSPYEIICSVLRTIHIPKQPIISMIGLQTKLFAGFGLKEYSTVEALKNMKLPLLLAHGEADTFVPCHMSQSAYDACASKDKTYLCVPEATHGMSYVVSPEQYKTALQKFIDRCLSDA